MGGQSRAALDFRVFSADVIKSFDTVDGFWRTYFSYHAAVRLTFKLLARESRNNEVSVHEVCTRAKPECVLVDINTQQQFLIPLLQKQQAEEMRAQERELNTRCMQVRSTRKQAVRSSGPKEACFEIQTKCMQQKMNQEQERIQCDLSRQATHKGTPSTVHNAE